MSDIYQQVEDVRASLKKLSDEAIELRRQMGSRSKPPETWETWRDALISIKGNVKIAISEGKKVIGEDDLLPWILQRIKGLSLGE